MRRWRFFLIALTMMLAAGSAGAVTVWRWVDQNGVTHYSDRPVEGAERIELTGAQTFPGAPPSARSGATSTLGAARTQTQSPSEDTTSAEAYRRFELTSPAQQETLWNIGGNLTVRVALDPPLQARHRLDVYLDGERRNVAATSTEFTVPEVYRGVHTLQGVVVDENGTELVRTLAVTFMVQQTSVQNPNNRTPPGRRN